MSFLLPLLMFLIFVACVAVLYTEGMWGNAICLINVTTAALLATNFFEPVAAWLEGMGPTYSYVWDFLALWGLFAVFMTLLRLGTDLLSRVRVRFLKIADRIGSTFFACWVGWVMVCFTMMTLHAAPLARNFLGGAFRPEQRMFLMGLAPDRRWLGFVQKQSRGAFCRSVGEDDDLDVRPGWKTQWTEDETRTFDPRSEFMPKYATRRANLEGYNKRFGSIRVNLKELPK